MIVKCHRALMTKNLKIGSGVASRSVLIALTKEFPKMVIGITEQQLTENKDAMNYPIAEKVCSEGVTDKLTRPEELATKIYLLLNRHIIKAYIDNCTSPSEKLFSAWYLAFFCRLWKEFLKIAPQYDKPDTMKTSIQNNFISSNLHGCIEINGHNILLFHNKCRDMKKPELFLPSLAGSQPCESAFRTLRSMSTTRSTVINFDVMEILQKSKRLRVLDTIKATTEDFVFTTKTEKEFLVPKLLLTDEQINEVVKSGFIKAKDGFAEFRKFLVIFRQEKTKDCSKQNSSLLFN